MIGSPDLFTALRGAVERAELRRRGVALLHDDARDIELEARLLAMCQRARAKTSERTTLKVGALAPVVPLFRDPGVRSRPHFDGGEAA